eukprot:TRINITY_DN9753_c0_g1_i1.p1 TRINITY_DN9753_c0_g1~~TRINITY_DN9753_c0_g1_i1.p1  ORF type:complete len:631 (+),score=104.14 TRINITY_DN9753_c0_g1_i1:125-2017(+)
MGALRRFANPLRNHGYRFRDPRACCTKSDILRDNLECGVGGHRHYKFVAYRCLPQKSLSFGPSGPLKFFVGNRSLSSQAGTERSFVKYVEDILSELETPPNADSNGKNSSHEKNIEELVSESELSDDDSEENLSEFAHNELFLSGIETGLAGDKESRKITLNSPLFKVILDAPQRSIHSTLDKWVEDGNTLGRPESSVAMLNLRKRRMFGRALQLAEWLEAKKRFEFTDRDYASTLDLIGKMQGLRKAEKYMEKIPQSFQSEVTYRTFLANCVSAFDTKKAEEVFNQMRKLSLSITPFSYNQLLLLYLRFDRKKIPDILIMMQNENVKPSLFTYRLLIDAKGRSNDINGMEQALVMMKTEGLAPSISIQAMMTRHYIFSGLKEKAEAVLKEMEREKGKNREAIKALLTLYAALGKADDVSRIWNEACKIGPRLEECVAAIGAWGKLKKVENAEAVFEKLLKKCDRLSSKHYNALLMVYAHNKMITKGKDLVKRMSDSGHRIGPLTWDALVRLYLEAGELEKADSILQKAEQQTNAVKPLFGSYTAILDKYSKRGDVHNAEKIFHRMKLCGYVSRIQQYQALLHAYEVAKVPAYGFRERMKADNMFPNKTVAAQLESTNAFRKTQVSDLLD